MLLVRSGDRGPEVQLHDAGVRPGEALALEWERVLAQTLVVDQAVSLGEEREVKSRNRSERVLATRPEPHPATRRE